MKRPPWRDTWIVLGIVGFVRLVYLLSTPFVMEGDGHHYYRHMLMPFHSNLVHASGYPFLMRFTLPLSQFLHVGQFEVLRFFQQLIPVLACVLFHRALLRVTSRWAALFASILIGTNFLSVSEGGVSMPESTLEAWLLLTMALFIAAATAQGKLKRFLYVAAGPVFAAGYLIKYNFAGFATLFLILFFDEALSLASRARVFLGAVATGAVVVLAYILFFHQPTTGSYALNLEHGWIHLSKLEGAKLTPRPEYGPATQKFLILSRLLPEAASCCSETFLKLDAVPDSVREPYRRDQGRVLALSDTGEIARLYETTGRPTTTYGDFHRLYYYLGLAETEALLKQVFLEALWNEPKAYLVDIFKYVREGLFEKHKRYFVRVPVPQAPFPLSQLYQSASDCNVLHPAPGSTYFETSGISCPGAHYIGPRRIWLPGLWFSMAFALPHLLTLWIFWPIALVGLVLAGRARGFPEKFHLVIGLTLVGSALFSSTIFLIRQKELLLLQPFFVLIFVLGVDRISRAVSRFRLPRVQLSDGSSATATVD